MTILIAFESNEEVEQVIASIDYRGEDSGSAPLLDLADRVRQQLNNTCEPSMDGRHHMVQPEDTAHIKWGLFGICECCHTVKKMPR